MFEADQGCDTVPLAFPSVVLYVFDIGASNKFGESQKWKDARPDETQILI